MEKEISQEDIKKIVDAALQARMNAYAPYSHFTVGAALMTRDGAIYKGCNIENASYGATNCAERTAFFKAVSEGNHEFAAIAIVGGMDGTEPEDYAYPCGVCRQVMQEFCSGDFEIYVVKSATEYQMYRLDALLPKGFGGASIR